MSNTVLVAWSGLVIGLIFGAVGQRTGFCLTSGIRRYAQERDGRMLRAFALACAIALIGSQILAAYGYFNLNRSLYIQPGLPWLAYLGGGLLFGYGMMLANGCGARALVLLGSGNLRSLVVLLMLGIAGQMTLTGLLAPLRLSITEATTLALPFADASLSGVLSHWGVSPTLALTLAVAAVAVPLLLFALADPLFRRSPRHILGGFTIGLLVPAGWFATGYLGADDFDPVSLASLTFIAPASNSIQYVMLSTGTALSFGVTVVAGIVAGSLATALLTGSAQLQGFPTPQRMVRYIIGGLFMGVGGAAALGCSIGQGLTGLSTLALGSFIAVAGILVGAWLGVRGPLRLSTV
ncbi:hypothetical protein CAI21_10375 [Alkalilimnicola ehrlichii]|uniref:Uncharacterized protein n=1 Tax=Alkalilimnicola ehrlichii TaxID=351052 RepID=A0A3E0WUL6_9GAMM|nr:YeeE/YedE family protein [Alkalilimnicola ehrlichii]RFA29166.1 hypothetical protein CAI21_10375 [Alkalilimnicola ehrlichii]RFA36079.1 hypothetical protein CAL65_11525 [Alkalilimnicola ehrlichii]